MMKSFTLPAGTVCHRNGIPFTLMAAALIECHQDNWALINDVPTGYQGDQAPLPGQSNLLPSDSSDPERGAEEPKASA